MYNVTSNAEEVLSKLLAQISNKKALIKEHVERQLRDLSPNIDTNQIAIVVNDGDIKDSYYLDIAGLTSEQEASWSQRSV